MLDMDKAKVVRWDLYVAGVKQGWFEDPQLSRTLELAIVAPSQYYKQAMGHRIMGVGLTLSVSLKEYRRSKLAMCCPWFAGDPAADNIPLAPTTLGVDMYDYAQQVVLHPRERASGAGYLQGGYDSHEDIVLPKAVCLGDFSLTHTDDETPIPLTWQVYPDRASLPAIVLAYIGPANAQGAEPLS